MASEIVQNAESLQVTLRYKGVEKRVTGGADEVIREILKFITEVQPRLELVSRLTLTVDAERFLSSCEGVLAATAEGTVILATTNGLTDRELMLLHLAKARFGFLMNKLEKDTLMANDLATGTKKSAGTVAGRLSEMGSEGLVERAGKGEYRITTYGADYFLKHVIPKVKAKEEVVTG